MMPQAEPRALPAPPDSLLDVPTLAKLLVLSVPALRSELKRGKIPAKAILKLGRRLRFDSVEIQAWLETLRKSNSAGAR